MALRVLLADESTTIKKVMQLALQDFAVEVKAVHAGVDVLEVARAFRPDIIFADVLLQKKNGYEVSAMLKADVGLQNIPVVLMWSSFMDLDEAQARASGAEARLEKPFDVETLRKQVLELVPATRSQRLAHFLDFAPNLNEELKSESGQPGSPAGAPPRPPAQTASAPAIAPAPAAQSQPPPTPARKGPPPPETFVNRKIPTASAPVAPPSKPMDAKSTWTMESFEDPSTFEAPALEAVPHHQPEPELGAGFEDVPQEEEEFQPFTLSQLHKPESSFALEGEELPSPDEADGGSDDEAWARQDLSQFKLDLPPISVGDEFNLDSGEEEFSMPNYQLQTEPSHAASPPAAMRRPPAYNPAHEPLGNDLTLDVEQISAADEEIPMPLSPLSVDEPLQFDDHIRPPAGSQHMGAEELERIIRAQSRDIIEQVVRKLVPDLAAQIIREELERLLEDTAVRDATR